jgi:LuxR family transcriptional regulator, maltose regulon positive regulatory protein
VADLVHDARSGKRLGDDLVMRVETGLLASRARWASGDLVGAERALDDLEHGLRGCMPAPGLITRLARARASLALTLDDVEAVSEYLPGILGEVADRPPEDRLIAAYAHLELGDAPRARRIIASLRGEGMGPRQASHALRVDAAAAARLGNEIDAARSHREADRIARIAGLVPAVRHRPVPPSTVAQRAIATERRPSPAGAGPSQQLSEPITPRELVVLGMLRDATNAEIADAMYVSVNTVKTHLKSLYRKLGVSSRDAAVDRAGALGLM